MSLGEDKKRGCNKSGGYCGSGSDLLFLVLKLLRSHCKIRVLDWRRERIEIELSHSAHDMSERFVCMRLHHSSSRLIYESQASH